MLKRSRALYVALAVVAAGAFSGYAAPVDAQQGTALPSARDLVDRFVEVIGGADSYRALTSIRATGAFELPAQGITGTVEVLSARPNKVLVRSNIEGFGAVNRGYDGAIGWSTDPASGPALITGRELAEFADDALFDSTLHPEAVIASMTTEERTTFDGKDAYRVKVLFRSGTEQDEFFDVASGLMLGSSGSRAMPMGVVPRVSFMRNFRTFGPLMQPTELMQQVMGIEQIVRFADFKYNDVPEDAFTLPPEVRALVGGR